MKGETNLVSTASVQPQLCGGTTTHFLLSSEKSYNHFTKCTKVKRVLGFVCSLCRLNLNILGNDQLDSGSNGNVIINTTASQQPIQDHLSNCDMEIRGLHRQLPEHLRTLFLLS